MATIETSRLLLRPLVPEDAKAVSHNSSCPSARHFMSDMVLETESDAANWINWIDTRLDEHTPTQVLGVERKQDHALMGIVGVAPKRELGGEIEILFSIADEYQNQGYATEAAKALLHWAFEEVGKQTISAIVKPANAASRRVIEKLGFRYRDTRILPYDGADCSFDYFQAMRNEQEKDDTSCP